ncbi:MAG: hypothetical protein J3Q66DRAFT_351100 [Benniella sp.]|nr:MAG: hypothetical protein J3Q66DRAFT_351100 [Benniella sp.]
MLDLQELDDVIFQQLSQHNLAQCARVSKKWHALVSPHLWRDFLWVSVHRPRRGRRVDVRTIVFEDYLAEQQHQKSQNDGNVEEPSIQSRPTPPLSALSKYGHWIRKLPDLDRLCKALEGRFPTGSDSSPTKDKLLLHLLKRCSPDIQVDTFQLYTEDMDLEPDSPRKSIVEFTLPRVRRLHMNFDRLSPPSELLKLMELLDQCTVMETLELGLHTTFSGTTDVKDKQMESEPKSWTSLKELILFQCNDSTEANAFWLWLLRGCSQVERVRIDKYSGTAQGFVQGMLAHMPHLCEISLGGFFLGRGYIPDNVVATLLSGSRNGWKSVRLLSSRNVGITLMDALAKHYSTLEVLELAKRDETFNKYLVQVLSSSPNLRNLTSMDFALGRVCFVLDAKSFIDLDPNTGLLKPWGCEGSLKELRVIIVGIPRPDLKGDDVIEETYPGQGRELQSRVYDRLARLTNLETLWLGDDHRGGGDQSLEMSLQSGLDKLSGLKNLKELNVHGMRTKIGAKEIPWIKVNWPKIRVIYGFDRDGSVEGEIWFQL